MSLIVTGSIGIDSVEAPTGTADNVLGGSAIYFAAAASFYCPVRLVAAVGDDFPETFLEMLRRGSLDGVVVAVWHAAHYEVARACLEHDLHVLLEKPMVLCVRHARDLCDLARQRQRHLIVGYPWHFMAQTLRARAVVQAGGLGRIHYVANVHASSPYSLFRGDDQSERPGMEDVYPVVGPGAVYADPERSGGGQGHLQVTHSASLILFITGLRPVSVQAQMDNLDVAVDVVDAITVRLDNGALLTLGSTGAVCSGQGKLDVQVYGDRGWMDLDYIAGTGIIRYAGGSDEELAPDPEAGDLDFGDPEGYAYPTRAPANNLVDVIRGRGTNGSPAEVGWRTVEVLEAAYRSAARDGTVVPIASLYDEG